ncbi:serine/threonine-protein kinase [Streptomyces avidinii]|uniref:serine/threonine-protein kinase n=1 Tax=Streptomyces avidinii TaxID=1895 RepID=UPI0037AF7C8B
MARYQPIHLGAQIADYQVEREIGRGGMSVVYLAKDLRMGRSVALKVLAPERTRSDDFRRRFLHESRVATSIDHPHIVPIFGAGEANGVLYIAMRYVDGPDLGALLDRDGPLPVTGTMRIAAQVASALDAVHEHRLVHGNVKPGNILLATSIVGDDPYYAYLIDFGLAKPPLEAPFTTADELVATVPYLAPEQISGRPVDGRGDLYSLACVVYEALAGGPVFPRDEDVALLLAHQYDSPPELSRRCPELTAAVDSVMAKAMAKSPEDRYGSCREFVAALLSAAGGRVS